MNSNLARPWANPPRCSPPQTPIFAFYNRQNETMLFDSDEEIEIFCQAGLRCSTGMEFSLHRNMIQTPFLTGNAEERPANLFKIRIETSILKPGFYDLKVKLDTGHERIKFWPGGEEIPAVGQCAFGWKVDELPLTDTMPPDFKEFWETALKEYREIPLDARIEDKIKIFSAEEINNYNVVSACLPPNYDPEGIVCDEVESCKISFAGPDGGRVYGWLAKPVAEGPFPGMLVLPGAGFAARPMPLEHARHGYVALDIQVHGQDVDLEEYETLSDFSVVKPHNSWWKNLYLRAVRAVDYLCSLPELDNRRLATVGGSQGGRLSTVVPALDKRISATVPCIINSPNYPHLNWVAKCNGKKSPLDNGEARGAMSDGMNRLMAPENPDTTEASGYAYFDPMNFAPYVTCPALLNAGLIDPVSPPLSVWAVFLKLGSSDKKIVPLPGLGHDWSAAFDRQAWRWLGERNDFAWISSSANLPSANSHEKE